MVAEGGGEGVPQWDATTLDRERLPLPSLKVPRELLRSFPHSKRVGSYLVGKMINKGSFAKVMEGLHIGTGEKVSASSLTGQLVRGDKTRRGSGWRRHTDKGRDHTPDYYYMVTTCTPVTDIYTELSLRKAATCYYFVKRLSQNNLYLMCYSL